MKILDEKDDIQRRRNFRDEEEEPDFLLEQRPHLLDQLKPDYSWIKYFQLSHPGWEFLRFEDIPWTPLRKEIAECKITYISFAGVYGLGQKPFNTSPGPVSEYLRRYRFKTPGDPSYREIHKDVDPTELMVSHADYDHADAGEDINCVFPLERLLELNEENLFGALGDTHYSLLGNVPDWKLIEAGPAKAMGDRLEKEGVDVVFLSPGCILSHQNLAVVQRYLESRGLVTVSITLCSDLTLQIGTPRSLSLHFPLGNVFGAPLDKMTQARILRDIFSSLEEFEEPGEIIELPYQWTVNPT